MVNVQVPKVDFMETRKRKKTPVVVGGPSATATTASPSVPTKPPPQPRQEQQEKSKAKEPVRSEPKKRKAVGGVDKDEDFCPAFYNFKLKRNVKFGDSVLAEPSTGLALISNLCLDADVAAMPKVRNDLIVNYAAKLALCVQTASILFESIANTDAARDRKVAELDERYVQAEGQMKQKLEELKGLFSKESEAKALAESNCAQLQKALEDVRQELVDYKAAEPEREKAVMEATIDQLKESVEEAKAKCRQQGMKQGFELGYRQGLEVAEVPKESPLWTLPTVPEYVDPDVEESEAEGEEGEGDGNGEKGDSSSVPKDVPKDGTEV